jgi:hypothetical protein
MPVIEHPVLVAPVQLALAGAHRKAARRYPAYEQAIGDHLGQLHALEKGPPDFWLLNILAICWNLSWPRRPRWPVLTRLSRRTFPFWLSPGQLDLLARCN